MQPAWAEGAWAKISDEQAATTPIVVANLGDLAVNRPLSVERILNKDWDNQIRCNEIAQGSPLTEQEVAVKQKTDPGYNAMCSPTANPNYEDN